MRIRPIRAEEVSLFTGFTGDVEQSQHVHDYVEQMFAAGTMRPEWCFLAHNQSNQPVGRVAFWTLPGLTSPLDLVLCDVDWHEHGHATGRSLILHVLELARELGATSIGYALDDPPAAPHFHHHMDERLALLHELGFGLVRATFRVESPEDLRPAPRSRLRYRSISEVGEERFLDAIARVSEGSFDQRILADRARLGIEEQAREMFDELLLMEYEPEWWRLAYTPAGEMVGLIMPASNYVFGVVGYIGVVPEQRGHGYVDDLLAEISTILHAAGYKRIRADGERLPPRRLATVREETGDEYRPHSARRLAALHRARFLATRPVVY